MMRYIALGVGSALLGHAIGWAWHGGLGLALILMAFLEVLEDRNV